MGTLLIQEFKPTLNVDVSSSISLHLLYAFFFSALVIVIVNHACLFCVLAHGFRGTERSLAVYMRGATHMRNVFNTEIPDSLASYLRSLY